MSSLENGLKILTHFSKERPVLRVGEVCRELDIPKSSASRLLKTLSEFGLVEREAGDAGYVLGVQALALADCFVAARSLLSMVNASIDELVSEFQFVGYVAVLSGADIIILRAKSGSYPLRLVHAVGRRMPALPTALGVTLLARQTDEQILTALDGKLDGDEARENALARIEETRRTGVFNLFDGMRSGVSAVGAAVCDPARHENISFSISYPSDAVDEPLLKRMRTRVREEALRIGKGVGDPFWSDPSRGVEMS